MVGYVTEDTVFEPQMLWAKLPHPMKFKEATSVAVDSQDRVYVFNRGGAPMIILTEREISFKLGARENSSGRTP